jgi:riboflavin biosynthesis pyrimidine reductase
LIPYHNLDFPPAPNDRPYTFINMVSTIDGKTISGDLDESVIDLGSKVDHEAMDRIEAAADAILIGGQTLRATSPKWNPKSPIRIGITSRGNIPFDSAFFLSPGAQSFIASPANAIFECPDHVQRINAGKDRVDPVWLAKYIRQELEIERLHILGGSETNAEFLKHNLVDELFLTLAPKLRLGRHLPTYAGGEPLDRDHMQKYTLIEHHVIENEVFLRYRRRWEPTA